MKFKDLISVIDGDAILNIITESRHTTSKNVDWLVPPQKGARACTPFSARACTPFSAVSKNGIIMFTKCSHFVKRLSTNFIFKLI